MKKLALILLLLASPVFAETYKTDGLLPMQTPDDEYLTPEYQKRILPLTYTVELVIDGDTIQLTNGEIVQLIGVDAPEIVFPKGADPTLFDPSSEAVNEAQQWGVNLHKLHEMGQEATEYMASQLSLGADKMNGKEVRLEFDAKEKDKYGRLLAYVYLVCPTALLDTYEALGDEDPIEKGIKGSSYYEIFLNAEMISGGYAQPMTMVRRDQPEAGLAHHKSPPQSGERPEGVELDVKYADLFKKLYQEAREQKRGLWK